MEIIEKQYQKNTKNLREKRENAQKIINAKQKTSGSTHPGTEGF